MNRYIHPAKVVDPRLHAERKEQAEEEMKEREQTLKCQKWEEGDREAAKELFARLHVSPGVDQDLVATYLYDHNNERNILWLQNLLQLNCGKAHHPCDLKIANIWAVDRPGDHLFRAELDNCYLLMYGCEKDHVFPILKNGFQDTCAWSSDKAVFKKGLYFQSCSSKAANFATQDAYRYERKADHGQIRPRDGSIIYIFFCHVALGTISLYENSVKREAEGAWRFRTSMVQEGLISMVRDPMVLMSGQVKVPIGPFGDIPKDFDKLQRSRQMYDDYCVIDPTQVRAKYLLEIQYRELDPEVVAETERDLYLSEARRLALEEEQRRLRQEAEIVSDNDFDHPQFRAPIPDISYEEDEEETLCAIQRQYGGVESCTTTQAETMYTGDESQSHQGNYQNNGYDTNEDDATSAYSFQDTVIRTDGHGQYFEDDDDDDSQPAPTYYESASYREHIQRGGFGHHQRNYLETDYSEDEN